MALEKKASATRILRKCLLTENLDSCKKALISKPSVAHHACFFKGCCSVDAIKLSGRSLSKRADASFLACFLTDDVRRAFKQNFVSLFGRKIND